MRCVATACLLLCACGDNEPLRNSYVVAVRPIGGVWESFAVSDCETVEFERNVPYEIATVSYGPTGAYTSLTRRGPGGGSYQALASCPLPPKHQPDPGLDPPPASVRVDLVGAMHARVFIENRARDAEEGDIFVDAPGRIPLTAFGPQDIVAFSTDPLGSGAGRYLIRRDFDITGADVTLDFTAEGGALEWRDLTVTDQLGAPIAYTGMVKVGVGGVRTVTIPGSLSPQVPAIPDAQLIDGDSQTLLVWGTAVDLRAIPAGPIIVSRQPPIEALDCDWTDSVLRVLPTTDASGNELTVRATPPFFAVSTNYNAVTFSQSPEWPEPIPDAIDFGDIPGWLDWWGTIPDTRCQFYLCAVDTEMRRCSSWDARRLSPEPEWHLPSGEL